MSILKKYIQENKKWVNIGIGTTAAIVTVAMVWLGTRKNAYAVKVEGKVVGIIKTKEEAQSAYDQVVAKIDSKVELPFVMNETLEVEAVHSPQKEIASYEALETAIAEAVSYKVEGYEILVEGTRYAVVSKKEEATHILKEIATQYAPQHGTVTLAVEEDEKSEAADKESPKTEGQEETLTENIQAQEESGKETLENDNTLVSNDASLEHTEEVSKVTISKVEKGEEKEEKEEAQDIQRTIQSYDFNQEIMIKSCLIDEEEMLSLEEAKKALLSDRYEIVDYKMVEGDNIWDIAVAFNTTEERIMALNPDITDATKMQIGQVIKVEKGIPILSITTVEESVFKELIPGEIQYKPSQHFYEGYTKVIVNGNDGLKELTVEVTKENGSEISRKTLSEKVLKEAKVTVIAYGVKEKEKEVEVEKPQSNKGQSASSNNSGNSNSSGSTQQSGSSSSNSSSSTSRTYAHPLKGAGTISSTYGPRWGTFHYGQDYAAPAGTPIYAARAGEVIYSGYNNGGYGKLVIIEHSDGTQTYYAHCSSLYVPVGTKVSQGQRIAAVGTTGDSTGNHLHFEIRINGRPVNPANYL